MLMSCTVWYIEAAVICNALIYTVVIELVKIFSLMDLLGKY